MNETSSAKTVLIVGDFADVNGGQAKVAIDSAKLLADEGRRVVFFAGTGPVSDTLTHENIEVVCLDGQTLAEATNRAGAAIKGLWNRDAARALGDTIEKLDPKSTVLHCHGWSKALSPSIGPQLASSALPVIYTMHEYFLACPNGGFYDYQSREICTRKALSLSCTMTNCDVRHWSHKAWRVARSTVAKTVGRLPSGLTHVAYISKLQKQVMEPYLSKDATLHYVPNPVAYEGPSVDWRANDDLLFVGRLSAEKGGRLFAQAARQVEAKAVFIGDGDERAALEAEFPEFEFTGWLSESEVADRLARARALVFPSLWYECQPLVPMEALLRGVPVVTGAWTAAAESVDHGRSGIVVQSRDADAFAEGIRALDTLDAFDSTALADLVSPQNHVARLCEIYDGMLARA